MGNTILQTLNLWHEGLIFFESFESPNFMLDQAWNLLNGVPARSNEVAEDGLYSFKLDTTYPWIEKDFNVSSQLFRLGQAWFFDDASVITGNFSPWMEVQTNTGDIYGVGVDMTVSTTHYTYSVNGVRTASTFLRINGFSLFNISYAVSGSAVFIQINNTSIHFTSTLINGFVKLRLGVSPQSGVYAFGYFDTVECFETATGSFKIFGIPDNCSGHLVDSTGAIVANNIDYSSGGVLEIIESFITSDLSNSTLYIYSNGTNPTPLFVASMQDYNPGDSWQYTIYDFGRKPSAWGFTDAANRTDLESTLGVKQSVFFNDSDRVTMTFMDLTEDEKNNLDRWWTSAKRGNNFGVAIDSDNTYFGIVGADNDGPTSVLVTIINPSTLTNPPVADAQIVIRDNDGYIKQTVKVDSVVSPTVFQLTEVPTEPTKLDQQIRSLYYWPFCTSTDKGMQATLTNLTLNRWTVTINFQEQIQP